MVKYFFIVYIWCNGGPLDHSDYWVTSFIDYYIIIYFELTSYCPVIYIVHFKTNTKELFVNVYRMN